MYDVPKRSLGTRSKSSSPRHLVPNVPLGTQCRKLHFTPMKLEKQEETYGVPKRSLGTRSMSNRKLTSFPTSRWERSNMKLCFTEMKLRKIPCTTFPNGVWEREVNPRRLVISFPTSRWERSVVKLHFTALREQKSAAYDVPKQLIPRQRERLGMRRIF